MQVWQKYKQQKAKSILLVGSFEISQIQEVFKVQAADFQNFFASQIKIEQMRELIHWLQLKPMASQIKIAVIEQADTMTTEAANAILKTLEEPPPNSLIFLTTFNEQKIIPTIKSRCHIFRLPVNILTEAPAEYISPEMLKKMSIKEKFDYAAKLSELEKNTIAAVLTAWQVDYRQKMLQGEKVVDTLKQLARAKELTATNISLKLLLENLLLNF